MGPPPSCALPPIDAPAQAFEDLKAAGWTYLNNGTARWVYKHPDCPWVLKENRCPGCNAPKGSPQAFAAQNPHNCYAANHIEVDEWLARGNAAAHAHLDPVGVIVTWSACRRFLVMEYLRDLRVHEQTVPVHRYTDLKRANFGVDANGCVKLRDYTEVKEPSTDSDYV